MKHISNMRSHRSGEREKPDQKCKKKEETTRREEPVDVARPKCHYNVSNRKKINFHIPAERTFVHDGATELPPLPSRSSDLVGGA